MTAERKRRPAPRGCFRQPMRGSPKAAIGDIEKVEHQTEMCADYTEARGLPLSDAHRYEDPTLSAWEKGVRRPQWDALMEAAKRVEIAGVLVYAVDRFTQRPKDLEAPDRTR